MTFISYVNFLPSFVTLVTEFLVSLLLLTLMMLAMVESVTDGEGKEPLVAMFLAKKMWMLQGLLFYPCKVSDCATID